MLDVCVSVDKSPFGLEGYGRPLLGTRDVPKPSTAGGPVMEGF